MPIAILAKGEDKVDLARIIADVREAVKGKNCGAIVTFTGIVRPRTSEGKAVDRLEYEVYPEAARKGLEDMARALCLVDGVLEAAVCHKHGILRPGEEVLYVVIATERSSVAFDSLRTVVTRVKHELPIWKKEFTTDGGYWVDVD